MKREKDYWKKQWFGVLSGAVVGLGMGALVPALTEQLGLFYLVLWSAIIGGVLANLTGFMRAGAALTRSEKRWINLLVGLGIPVVFLALCAILVATVQR